MSDTPVVPVLVDGQIVPMLDARGAWHGRSVTTHQGGPMTTRYYEETECEHGSKGICDHIPTDRRAGACMRLDCNVLHAEPCPGGQRRELTGVEVVEVIMREVEEGFTVRPPVVRRPGRYAIIPLEDR